METKRCPYCGASMKMFWHRITPGMVMALVKFKRSIIEKDRNCLHLYKDLENENKLTTVEQMNWTKLRFHGLVAKYRENGVVKRGYWLLTRRGNEFFKGTIKIPKRVQTFRNKITCHDEEYVNITNVVSDLPYWDNSKDYLYEFADISDFKYSNDNELPYTFDQNGQGKINL